MERYIFTEEKRSALESLRQPFAVYQFINKRVVTLLLSDGFCELFGYENREDALYDMDHNMYKDTHPDDAARIADAAFRFATEGGRYEAVYRTRKKRGPGYVVVHALGEHVCTEDGVRLAQIWYTDEGTYMEDSEATGFELTRNLSNALHEQSLIKASQYDYLTGLPNMTYFFELADAGKKDILERGGQMMLLYIDFSGMKFFNAKHGFAEGDRMLQSFSRMLVDAFSNESCCRIGADHFAVFTEEPGLEEKLKGIFREFGELYGGKTPPVHVGIYPYRIEDVPVSAACDRAKLACRALGGSYASGFNYFSAVLAEDAVKKQYIIENFNTAIREKWIKVYLQPIIRSVNGKVCDVEALARWIDPEKGILSPAVFIPALEEAGLICRLDLYMVDQVLEAMKDQKAAGFDVIPHSINLSRSDFDACDIVEEIRRRVDAAGVGRDKITIEITESVLGRDFEFMKGQVEKFQKLGFPVWMDDFGSGYSSMDVLQSIRFDLIKFDMSFMKKLDEGDEGKVILTDLMRMATSLGIDTVCEGVEKKSQVRFLQEIGCSKLQGFYYSRPIPFEEILEKSKTGDLIKNEDPEESDYFESISRVNLFDFGVVASGEEDALQNTFSTIPMAILEYKDGHARYLRSSVSYQNFIKRFFDYDISEESPDFHDSDIGYCVTFISVVKQCCKNGKSAFFDQKMQDGSVVHSFARRISVNPVTGSTAVALAVLSISEPDESTTYADIARALAADYFNLFVIDLDTDDYIEYSSRVGGEELSNECRGKDFFEAARRDTATRIYEEDREHFLSLFTKEKVIRDLDTQGLFTTSYRSIDSGTPVYVNMKITRMSGGNRIILGVSNIDKYMKQKKHFEELQKEREMLVRVMALSDGYLTLFTVDPKTGNYVEYSSSDDFDSLGAAKNGSDFFGQAFVDAYTYCYEPDRQRFQKQVTLDNVLSEIRRHGSFRIDYHLLIRGLPRPVTLKAALFKEGKEDKLVVGVRERKE